MRVPIIVLAAVWAGCGMGDEPDPIGEAGGVLRFDAAKMAELEPGETWLADLSQPENVVVIDQTAGVVDRSLIWIVCPSGMQMTLEGWLVLQAPAFRSIFDAELVAVSLTSAEAEAQIPETEACPRVCWTCTDGATACGPSCGPGEGSGGSRSPPNDPDLEPPTGDSPDPEDTEPPPSSPAPDPPPGV